MKHTTKLLLHALALVPGQRRLAARLGVEPARWSPVGAWFVHAMVALGMQVICMAVIRRLHGRTVAWSP
jgi:hypothetical protein